MIKRVLLSAGILWAGATLLNAQAPARTRAVAAPARQAAAAAPAAPDKATIDKQKAWVKQYCVTCHNTRNPLPANDPVNLETASLEDLTKDAATWERVLRKLNVRAMPPQGMPHPTEAGYTDFTGWLTTSLDRGWQGKAIPGRYVVHRLNRAEYRNAVRDLLALDVDVSSLLPNDGATSASTTSRRR